jgi:hypothetical protein
MMEHNPPRLELPCAALHAAKQRVPHVDSEEAVQYERRRVSRELDPIYSHAGSRNSSEAPHTSPSFASLRSRNTSLQNSTASHAHLRRPDTDASDVATELDVQTANGTAAHSTTSSMRPRQWYTPITSFWSTHISITIEEGAHRDHLGTSNFPSPSPPSLLTLRYSTRTHFPRLLAHFPHPRHDRYPDSSTLPTSAFRQPKQGSGLLCYWTTT